MKRLGVMAGCVLGAILAWGDEEVVDGVTWHYVAGDGVARLVGGEPAYAGDLVVPDELGGLPVTGIDQSAFGFNGGVTSVSLPRGVTNLPKHAFCNDASLTNVSSRAAFVHWGESSLSGTGLRSFAVPEGETHVETDLFHGADRLESVTLPSTLVSMGRSAFRNCASLTEIRFPAGFEGFGAYDWDAHWPFDGCTGLADAYFAGPVPANFDCSGLPELDCRIHYPRALAAEWEAVVPADSFGGFSAEGGPDEDGTWWQSVDGVTWRYTAGADGATVVGGVPAYAGDLVVPDELGGLPVTGVDQSAFGFNGGVTSVSLPRGVTNLPKHAFCNDAALTNVSSRAAFVRWGESSLSGTGLRSFAVPEGETHVETDLFHGADRLESVTLPSTLVSMGRSAFRNCTSLTEIRFPAGFEGFGAYDWDAHWPFDGCTGLADAYFAGPVPANFDCSGLPELDCRIHYPRAFAAEWEAVVPADRFGGYVDGDGPVPDGPADPDPVVPGIVRTDVVDGTTWFYVATNGGIRVVGGEPAYSGDLVVPDALGGHAVTEVDASAFGFNPGVTSVSLPCGVTNLPMHAFCNDAALTNVSSRAAHLHLGESCLSGTALRRFEVPEGETRLEADVFRNDAGLEWVRLPSTLTSMGRSVFADCTSLAEIRFPAGFASFARTPAAAQQPFNGCTSLGHVYFFGHVPENFEYSGLLSCGLIHYPSKYAAEWRAIVPSDRFGGYSDGEEQPLPPCTARVSGYAGEFDGAGHGVVVEDLSPAWATTAFACAAEGPFLETPPLFTNAGVRTVWCRVAAAQRRPVVLSATVEIRPRAFSPGAGPEMGGVSARGFDGVYDGAGHAVAVDVSGVPDAGVAFAAGAADFDAGRSALEAPVFTNVVDATVWFQVTASNYTPYVGSASVRIAPRPLTLSSRGGSKVYDGRPLVRPEVVVGGLGFAPGEGMELTVTGSQTEIGTSENTFLWTPATGTLTSNYEVVVHYGLLRVTRTRDGTVILFE